MDLCSVCEKVAKCKYLDGREACAIFEAQSTGRLLEVISGLRENVQELKLAKVTGNVNDDAMSVVTEMLQARTFNQVTSGDVAEIIKEAIKIVEKEGCAGSDHASGGSATESRSASPLPVTEGAFIDAIARDIGIEFNVFACTRNIFIALGVGAGMLLQAGWGMAGEGIAIYSFDGYKARVVGFADKREAELLVEYLNKFIADPASPESEEKEDSKRDETEESNLGQVELKLSCGPVAFPVNMSEGDIKRIQEELEGISKIQPRTAGRL